MEALEGWDFHPNNREANKKRFEALGEEQKTELIRKGYQIVSKQHKLPLPKPVVDGKCALCGNDGGKLCSACHTVAYCCKEHQRAHWKQHKPDCLKNRSGEDEGRRWIGEGCPPHKVAFEALMAQGGKANYLKSVTSIKPRAGSKGQWEVRYEWLYDENDKGTSVALLELEQSTTRLLLMSWNWSENKASDRFNKHFDENAHWNT